MVIVERLKVLTDKDIDHMLRNANQEFKDAKKELRSAQFNVKYKEISYKMRYIEMQEVAKEKLIRMGWDLTINEDKPIPDFTKSPY